MGPTPSVFTASARPASPVRKLHPRHATADGLDGGASRGLDTIFTVFDRVNHFRVLPCRAGASAQELAAAALAATPELPQARGLRLRRGIPGLPDPQIVLFEDDVQNRVTRVVGHFVSAPLRPRGTPLLSSWLFTFVSTANSSREFSIKLREALPSS